MGLSRKFFMNKSVIILGGAGFLGKEIEQTLTSLGHKCVIGDISDTNVEVEFRYIDVLSHDDILKSCKEFDIVINCTGQITNPIFSCYEQNTKGIENIVRFCKTQKTKLIHISSVSVYGSAAAVEENSNENPETVYAACKLFAEHLISYNLPENQYFILRLSNLYGINQPKGILAYLKKSFDSDKILNFNNNGDMKRYYLNIKDCCNIISQVINLENIGGIFNIVGNDFASIKELINLIENITQSKYKVHFTKDLPWENLDKIDDRKINNLLKVKYKETLQKFIETNFK